MCLKFEVARTPQFAVQIFFRLVVAHNNKSPQIRWIYYCNSTKTFCTYDLKSSVQRNAARVLANSIFKVHAHLGQETSNWWNFAYFSSTLRNHKTVLDSNCFSGRQQKTKEVSFGPFKVVIMTNIATHALKI